MKMAEYIYYGIFTLAMVLIFFAYKQYNKSTYLLTRGIKTKATVVDLIRMRHTGSDYTYKPIYEYKNKNGETITYKSNMSSRPAPYNIGDKVNIIYSNDTNDMKIISYWGLYRWTIVLLCIAAPLLIISGGYFLYARG